MINSKIGKFSLNHSSLDNRDHIYKQSNTEIKPSVDLREYASPVQDQMDLGSCVAAAITDSYELAVNRLYPKQAVVLSKLFVYYNGRLLDGLIGRDVGSTIRNSLKGAAHFGICSEELWPYDFANVDTKPTPICYRDGSYRVIPKYERIHELQDLLDAINNDYSVVVGLNVYEDFTKLDNTNYMLSIPDSNSEKLGLHAMSLVGYDLDKSVLWAKNSFGKNWGLDGYCQIPFQYAQTQFFENWKFDIAIPELTS